MSIEVQLEVKRYAFELLSQLHRTISAENIQPTALMRVCSALGEPNRRIQKTVHPYRALLYERAIEIEFGTNDPGSDARFASAIHAMGFAVTVANLIQATDVQRLRKLIFHYMNLLETTFAAAEAGVADRAILEGQLRPYLESLAGIRDLLGVMACFSFGQLPPTAPAGSPEIPAWEALQEAVPNAFPALVRWICR